MQNPRTYQTFKIKAPTQVRCPKMFHKREKEQVEMPVRRKELFSNARRLIR